ncbi:MAG: TlyA family RNA methyltransferase [Syntrophomonadaceae bacterium]|nr:TlyA family RNA methyltransferase [Syntrophomonadaceae bacterium]
MGKIRLDILLHQQGLAPSREKARAMILAGEVTVNGTMYDKPGTNIDENGIIEIKSSRPPYVSRGGLKLEKAIKVFAVDFTNKTVWDVGASTGGYTDCALKHGARKVFALDVGYGQLDWTLRNDPRVVNIERTNIRYFDPELLGEIVDIVTIDVAFISTAKVFPVINAGLKDDGQVISLIKPQFEAGRDKVGKKGVVKDKGVHKQVLWERVQSANQAGLFCKNLTWSPIKGPQGNIEYFILLNKEQGNLQGLEAEIEQTVETAHQQLEV